MALRTFPRQQPSPNQEPLRSAPQRTTASRSESRPASAQALAELRLDSAYRRVPLGPDEIGESDCRFEFWDRDTETAFEVRDVSPYHESPAQTLSALAELIAAVRGKPIRCFGTMSLAVPGEDGRPLHIMEADQSLYLHPERPNLFGHEQMMVGEHHYPNVVLEVDRTTDVRRHKLKLYEAWGFPELWVEVPDEAPRPRVPRGTTIYVLEKGRFQVAESSRAFPGWTAADIHLALNEPRMSEYTAAILERIGTALGEREGSGPDDHPLLRSLMRSERQRVRAAMVRDLMIARGFEIGADFPLDQPDFATASAQAIANAVARCESPDDFIAMLRDASR